MVNLFNNLKPRTLLSLYIYILSIWQTVLSKASTFVRRDSYILLWCIKIRIEQDLSFVIVKLIEVV